MLNTTPDPTTMRDIFARDGQLKQLADMREVVRVKELRRIAKMKAKIHGAGRQTKEIRIELAKWKSRLSNNLRAIRNLRTKLAFRSRVYEAIDRQERRRKRELVHREEKKFLNHAGSIFRNKVRQDGPFQAWDEVFKEEGLQTPPLIPPHEKANQID